MAETKAWTRAVSPLLADCALTHLSRQPIDATRAAEQHGGYEAALRAAGLEVERLPALPEAPDGVFVEDTALILGSHAVITRPGAASRAGETQSTARGLDGSFGLHRLDTGTLDGGDVLRIDENLYVGLSARTDRAGAEALAAVAAPLGYSVIPVTPAGCLHLKSAACYAGHDRAGDPILLFNPDWVSPEAFAGVVPLAVAPGEPFAANVLRVGDRLIVAAGFPETAARLAARGFDLVEVDTSELQKAEAGLTCMSLICAT